MNKADLLQLKSAWSQRIYGKTMAENAVRSARTDLKQLLELNISNDFNVDVPVINETEILATMPLMTDIYNTSLLVMPQVKQAVMNIESANYDIKIAKSSWAPSLTLNAGVGANYSTGLNIDYGNQLYNTLLPSAGLTLSVSIYDKSQTSVNVAKAKLALKNSELDYEETQKQLAKQVESLYIDAIASQEKYKAAKLKLEFAEETYYLVSEQFEAGIKNTLDLLTAQVSLLTAQLELSESKYQAVISIQLLNILQDLPIVFGE